MYQDYNYFPYQSYQTFPSRGLRGGLFGLFRRGNDLYPTGSIKQKFDWGNFLSNTQKTLNVVNQAIPIFYQIRPILNNAKTMFKIMGALKDDDENPNNLNKEPAANKENYQIKSSMINNDNLPQFFI